MCDLSNESSPNARRHPRRAMPLFGLVLVTCNALGCGGTTLTDPRAESPAASAPTAAASSTAKSIVPAPSPTGIQPGDRIAGMVWIPAATFQMGTDDGPADERPAHRVSLDGYWMDETEVTNRQFAEFVDATGYVTLAERTPTREMFLGQVDDVTTIPAENLVAGSICFHSSFDPKSLVKDHPLWVYQLWKYVKNANWRHPEGDDSNLDDRWDHPVVHVSWDDAMAYAAWLGRRLPTEAEYEFAARGGLPAAEYPWGDDRNPNGQWLTNIWQGEFPYANQGDDGFLKTSPVRAFPPNGFGCYDLSGNVWEWCYDWYQPAYYEVSPVENPPGPSQSFDPLEPTIPKRVQRGGSFMCSDNYCEGYRTSTRMKGDPSSSTFHCGFRTVLAASSLGRITVEAMERQLRIAHGDQPAHDGTIPTRQPAP